MAPTAPSSADVIFDRYNVLSSPMTVRLRCLPGRAERRSIASLIDLIPIVGWIILLVFFVQDSHRASTGRTQGPRRRLRRDAPTLAAVVLSSRR